MTDRPAQVLPEFFTQSHKLKFREDVRAFGRGQALEEAFCDLFLLREFRILAPWDRVPHTHEHASANL